MTDLTAEPGEENYIIGFSALSLFQDSCENKIEKENLYASLSSIEYARDEKCVK